MPRPSIIVSAPSRLHFGLFAVGDCVDRHFGGMGMMIEQPRTTICIREADSFSIKGENQENIRSVVENWFARFGPLLSPPPNFPLDAGICLEVCEQPPQHQGLGSGTQLALTVATALFRYFDLPLPKPGELAAALGRGTRSAIGTYGFFRGGLLVDRGTLPAEPVAPLDFQTDFPGDWPIVVSLLTDHRGLHGADEWLAFEKLAAISDPTRQEMIRIVKDTILPAVMTRDYNTFAQNLYNFGRQSGLLFQSIQGGFYNGEAVAGLVKTIRDFGIAATGQSSWGPCVFAICPDVPLAEKLLECLDRAYGEQCESFMTFADNTGATSKVFDDNMNRREHKCQRLE